MTNQPQGRANMLESPVLLTETDAELLRRLRERQEADAFATLLGRHGPMVLAVCRRVLRDHHLAEDVFQETFVELIRRAGTIAQPELLGGWLYRVAYRLALHARDRRERLRKRETGVNDLSVLACSESLNLTGATVLLDTELNGLPEKYRAPLVLCYLEGQTNSEAARQLGCPKGTVQVRLARARDLLRQRLTRRGVCLSAGSLLFLLTSEMASASVPEPLTVATIRGAAQALNAVAIPVSADEAVSKKKYLAAVVVILFGTTAAALAGWSAAPVVRNVSVGPPPGAISVTAPAAVAKAEVPPAPVPLPVAGPPSRAEAPLPPAGCGKGGGGFAWSWSSSWSTSQVGPGRCQQ